MMKKEQSHWWCMIWIAVTIPFIGSSLTAFSKPKETLRNAVDNSVRIIEQPLTEVVKSDLSKTETAASTDELPKTEQADIPQPPVSDVKPGDVITGSVSNQDGQPFQYANLVEEDEYHRIVAHAITDTNGKFTLKVVDPKHKIRISYVGYKSKTIDISGKQIDVVLEPNTLMKEVKVVGRTDSINLDAPRHKEQTKSSDPQTYNLVEQAPVFPGGQAGIIAYLNQHLNYPSVAKEMSVEADIVVRFTVDKTGLVRSPQIVNVTSESPLITAETMKAAKEGNEDAAETAKNYYDAVEAMKEEAIHVVRNMPRWEPGRQNGTRIETTWTLPISFKLK